MTNPETPKNTLTSSPKSPSDTLLKNFRSTLEKRWSEFDIATMKEAQFQVNRHPLGGFTDAQTARAKDANFIKAKAAFDQARIALGSVTDDKGLKQTLNSPGNLLSAIQTLEAHFALATAPEKAKEYNHVLANTLADLTSLRSQVTDTAEDKKAAEVAAVAVKAMPAVAVAGIATGAAATDALGNLTGGLTDVIGEGATALGDELTAIKKNPMKKIAEFFGFTDASIGSDIKEALTEKKSGGFDGFFAGLKLRFYGLMAKIGGVDLSKTLSPEEMKLAGLTPEVSKEQKKQETREKVKNTLEPVVYASIASMLTKKALYEPGESGFFVGFNQDEARKIQTEKEKIAALLSQPSIKSAKYSDIVSKKMTTPVGATASDMEGVIKVLLKNEAMIASIVVPHLPEWKNESLDTILSIASIHGGFLFQYHDMIEVVKKDTADLDVNKAMSHIDLFSPESPLIQSSINKMKDTEKNGFTQNIITMGLVSQKHLPIDSFKTKDYKGFESTLSGEEKLFMEKIFVYAEKILPTLYRIVDAPSRVALQTMFTDPTKSPKLGEIMALYILTGGKTDIGSMNVAEKTALSIAPLKFATINNDAKVSVPLMQYYSGIIMDGESFIPPEARDILRVTFSEVRDAALKKMGEYAGWSIEAVTTYAKENPTSTALWIGSFALGGIGAIRLLWGAKLFVVGGLATAIGTKMAIADTSPTKK